MADDFADRFWKTMCEYRAAVALLLGLEAVLLVLLFLALWLQPDGVGTRVVLVADFAFIGTGFLAASYVLYRCRQYRRLD
ncbi:hypothetical protein [Halosolutus gelatinilyticus]|uniref:hypothetical protein n=1 Tax=Halosolutus gelatinilyticus TaxID=2931975 RepID=UPI001FF1EA9A|nr:hypothetical protein [Halosolutus gelatinilyticus]